MPTASMCYKTKVQGSMGSVQAVLMYNGRSTDLRGLALCIAIYGSGRTSDDAF